MSLLSQAYLLETYGLRLSIEDLAKVLDRAASTIYNQLAQGKFEIATYLDGGRRFADYRDVAAHFDSCRERAKTAVAQN